MAEEQHETGREYLEYFNGLLTLTLKHLSYKKIYDAYKNEKRVSFKVENEKFSFDAKGIIEYNGEQRDVWIESKGYSKGDKLLESYKDFIRRAYKTVINEKTHEDDIFIFVTNVPFGASIKNLFKREYIIDLLKSEYENLDSKTFLKIEKLSNGIFGIIFTDPYVKLFTNNITFNKNDSLWKFWQNREEVIAWESFLEMVKILNPTIKDLNKIKLGDIVTLPKI